MVYAYEQTVNRNENSFDMFLHEKKHNSYILREMEMEITLWSHFLLIRLAKFQKIKNIPCWQGCEKTGPFVHCWWEFILVQPLWRAIWRYLSKLQMQICFDPVIPHLGIYPTDRLLIRVWVQNDIPLRLLIAAFFVVKDWKQITSLSIRAFKINHHMSIQWHNMQLLKRRKHSECWYGKICKIH